MDSIDLQKWSRKILASTLKSDNSFNQMLIAFRSDVLEEAAKICDEEAIGVSRPYVCARKIREIKTTRRKTGESSCR